MEAKIFFLLLTPSLFCWAFIIRLSQQYGTTQKFLLQFVDYISKKFLQININGFEHKRKFGIPYDLLGLISWFISLRNF